MKASADGRILIQKGALASFNILALSFTAKRQDAILSYISQENFLEIYQSNITNQPQSPTDDNTLAAAQGCQSTHRRNRHN